MGLYYVFDEGWKDRDWDAFVGILPVVLHFLLRAFSARGQFRFYTQLTNYDGVYCLLL